LYSHSSDYEQQTNGFDSLFFEKLSQ